MFSIAGILFAALATAVILVVLVVLVRWLAKNGGPQE